MSGVRIAAGGALLGVFGVLAFGTVHALLIMPIWGRLAGGLPFTIAAGTALAWAYREFSRSRPRRVTTGIAFGAIVWLSLLPMTAFALWLRRSGLRPSFGDAEIAIELILAAASGALAVWLAAAKTATGNASVTACVSAGWLACRSRMGALTMAIAMPVLTAAMAGPVPAGNSVRAAALFATFLPIYLAAGAVLEGWMRFANPANPHRKSRLPPVKA
jgi:hypothetical protein